MTNFSAKAYWYPGDGSADGPSDETCFAVLDLILRRVGITWASAGLSRQRYGEMTNRVNLAYWNRHYVQPVLKRHIGTAPLANVLGLLQPLMFDLEDQNHSEACAWLADTFNISYGDVGLFYDAAFTRVPDNDLHRRIREKVPHRSERNYFGAWVVRSFDTDSRVAYKVSVNNTTNHKYGLDFGAECTCPHYTGRLAGTDEVCKHIKAVFGLDGSGFRMFRAIYQTPNEITYQREKEIA